MTTARDTASATTRPSSSSSPPSAAGRGLPLVPPTAERVEAFVAASGLPGSSVVCKLPPLNGDCTVELIAVNAILAGASAGPMPLLVAAVAATADPDFELRALNATIASVVPATIVNGPQRHALDITGPNIGRAIRLIMRNVAAQRAGVTPQSVVGQPSRTAGIVFNEWEERSPWAPLAERGFARDAVTGFAAMGTTNILDLVSDSADLLLDFLGRSLAYPGANGYLSGFTFSEVVVEINPIWAEIIGRAYPDIETVENRMWDAAALPIDSRPVEYRKPFEDAGRIGPDDGVHLMNDRDGRVLVVVCGGLGGLHGLAMHGFGASTSITRPVPGPPGG